MFPGTDFSSKTNAGPDTNRLASSSARFSLKEAEVFLFLVRGGQTDTDVAYFLLNNKKGLLRVQTSRMAFDWDIAKITEPR